MSAPPVTRSLEAVLLDAMTQQPPLRMIVGAYRSPASADARYANVTVQGQDLTLSKIKGSVDGAAGKPAYILAAPGFMLVLGTVST